MREFKRSIPMLLAGVIMFAQPRGSIQFAILFAAFCICGALAICATLADKQ